MISVKLLRKDDDCELKDNTFSLATIYQNYSLMTENLEKHVVKRRRLCLLVFFISFGRDFHKQQICMAHQTSDDMKQRGETNIIGDRIII